MAPPSTPGTGRLLADIGGTNARFAWQAGAGEPIENVRKLPSAQYATLADAMRDYLEQLGRSAPPQCAIAIANPVLGDRVQMTNHHWSFSISALQEQFGFTRLRVLNDFTALALALPSLPAAELRQVGGGTARPGCAIGLIGPGTGLGVSGLIPVLHRDRPSTWVPLRGEGGHVTLAAGNQREAAVLAEIGGRLGHVSAERALSGPGLVNLHRALVRIDAPGAPEVQLKASEISARALQGDATCAETLNLFCALLGSVAGNLALTLGAHGGVYIGGGIVPRLGEWFERSPFRSSFEAKGRFSAYLAAIPVFVIVARESPALLGAAIALETLEARDAPETQD